MGPNRFCLLTNSKTPPTIWIVGGVGPVGVVRQTSQKSFSEIPALLVRVAICT